MPNQILNPAKQSAEIFEAAPGPNYYRCYQTSSDPTIREQVWATIQPHAAWVQTDVDRTRFWIPERLVAWCLLIDPDLTPVPSADYIV